MIANNKVVVGKLFMRIIQLLFGVLMSFAVTTGYANPEGGSVVHGQAQLNTNNNMLTITQSTDSAIINWQSFNIHEGEHTHIQMPQNGISLNRVLGHDPSKIMGKLSADGTVILSNPNGVLFGNHAEVNVGGLLATTSGMTNEDFIARQYRFKTSPDQKVGSIINHGRLSAKEGGLIALVAPQVENHGVISANLGRISLAGGDKFTVDFYGDKMIQFVDHSLRSEPQSVINTGELLSDGGKIQITTQGAKKVLDNTINVSGLVRANSVSQRNGAITLYAGGQRGHIKVSGKIHAKATKPHENAGKIKVVTRSDAPSKIKSTIEIGSAAELDVSAVQGKAGGISIGTPFSIPGQDLPLTHIIKIAPNAQIKANASGYRHGGSIVVSSIDQLILRGTLEANQGGIIETSTQHDIEYDHASVSASKGKWLFAGNTITIEDGNVLTIQNALMNNTHVEFNAKRAIELDNPSHTLAWNTEANLKLIARNDIVFNDNAKIKAGGFANVTLRSEKGTFVFFENEKYIEALAGNVNLQYHSKDWRTPLDFSEHISSRYGLARSFILIDNQNALSNIRQFPQGNYALASDLKLQPHPFVAIGDAATPFQGVFDGHGHTIKGLNINTQQQAAGLFGVIDHAVIRDLNLDQVKVLGSDHVGALVGVAKNSKIHQITINGNVFGENQVGGVVGSAQKSMLSHITVSGEVTGGNEVGGIAGKVTDDSELNTITNSSNVHGSHQVGGMVGVQDQSRWGGHINLNVGEVSGDFQVGGIAGIAKNHAEIDVARNFATVRGFAQVGGIAGNLDATSKLNAVVGKGKVQGTFAVGGLVGESSGQIVGKNESTVHVTASGGGGIAGVQLAGSIKGINHGSVAGEVNSIGVGGISGRVKDRATIHNSENHGTVKGGKQVGGIVGESTGIVIDANRQVVTTYTLHKIQNHGKVYGVSEVGGIAGYNIARIEKAKNDGAILGSGNDIGGIAGTNAGLGIISMVSNHASVQGRENVGGIAGYHQSGGQHTVTNIGDIAGQKNVGGLAGKLGLIGKDRYQASVAYGINQGNILGLENTDGSVGLNISGSIHSILGRNIKVGNSHPIVAPVIAVLAPIAVKAPVRVAAPLPAMSPLLEIPEVSPYIKPWHPALSRLFLEAPTSHKRRWAHYTDDMIEYQL